MAISSAERTQPPKGNHPLITATLKRDGKKQAPKKPSVSSDTTLSLLKAIDQHIEHYPFVITLLMVEIAKNLLKKSQETIDAAKQKDYDTLLKTSKARLPSFKTQLIFFPPNKGNKKPISWDGKKTTIKPNDYLELIIQRSAKKIIEIDIKRINLSDEHSEETIASFARIICECTRGYQKALITIDFACFESPQVANELIVYLYAYQKIQNSLSDKASKPISKFSIQLKDGRPYTPSDASIDQIVHSILQKDPGLKSLYETPSFALSIKNA